MERATSSPSTRAPAVEPHGPCDVRLMTLLVVGNATVDVSFELEALPRPGETLLARGRMVDAGGKGLNQAVVARRAGAEVIYVAAVGDDPEADFIHARLAAEGLPGADLLCRSGPTD